MTEASYPHIEGDSWVGILAPAGTPADIIAVLHRECEHDDDMSDFLSLSAVAVGGIADMSRSLAARRNDANDPQQT